MTALTAERDTIRAGLQACPDTNELPVAASTKIYKGSLVMAVDGYAKPGAATARGIVMGRAAKTVDNSDGSDGDLSVTTIRGVFQFANSTSTDEITDADVGANCYVVDDQTVALTSNAGARPIAGQILGVDGDGVWVQTGLPTSPRIQAGTTTLVAGTKTVTGVVLTAASRIVVTRKTPGGTIGDLSAPSASRDTGAGSFVINAAVNTDTSTVDYVIVG